MADTEIKGSRRDWEDGKFAYGEKISVGTAVADAPNTGDYFTPSGTTTAESGVTGRKAVRVDVDPEVIPGIFLFRTTYRAFKAYS